MPTSPCSSRIPSDVDVSRPCACCHSSGQQCHFAISHEGENENGTKTGREQLREKGKRLVTRCLRRLTCIPSCPRLHSGVEESLRLLLSWLPLKWSLGNWRARGESFQNISLPLFLTQVYNEALHGSIYIDLFCDMVLVCSRRAWL